MSSSYGTGSYNSGNYRFELVQNESALSIAHHAYESFRRHAAAGWRVEEWDWNPCNFAFYLFFFRRRLCG
jgi:hypothetical protein